MNRQPFDWESHRETMNDIQTIEAEWTDAADRLAMKIGELVDPYMNIKAAMEAATRAAVELMVSDLLKDMQTKPANRFDPKPNKRRNRWGRG